METLTPCTTLILLLYFIIVDVYKERHVNDLVDKILRPPSPAHTGSSCRPCMRRCYSRQSSPHLINLVFGGVLSGYLRLNDVLSYVRPAKWNVLTMTNSKSCWSLTIIVMSYSYSFSPNRHYMIQTSYFCRT